MIAKEGKLMPSMARSVVGGVCIVALNGCTSCVSSCGDSISACTFAGIVEMVDQFGPTSPADLVCGIACLPWHQLPP